MNILALDLGTATGWACSRAGIVSAGTWILGTDKEKVEARKLRLDRRCDPRFLRLLHRLTGGYSGSPDFSTMNWVVFEDVEFCKSRMQAHLWATWRAAIWAAFGIRGVKIDCLATGKLKSFATGNGGATKEQMAKALTMDPRYALDKGGVRDTLSGVILDDNAVDALHLLRWATETFK